MNSNLLISVVIPTCNRPDLLAACLRQLGAGCQTGMTLVPVGSSLTALEGQGDRICSYEVIVTDDGLKTSQELIAAEFPWAKWVPGPRRGPASNRNNGAKAANGCWIAFADDDCLPDAGWLNSLSETIASHAVNVVEGKIICPGKRDDPFEEHVENLEGGVYWSCNVAFERSVFERLGGFDEEFGAAGGEDMEMAWRIRTNGIPAVFSPGFMVVHPPRRMSWKKIWWRTLMIKWMILYNQKTGQTPPGLRAIRSMAHVAWGHTLFLMRKTWQLRLKSNATRRRTEAFWIAWNWLTWPIIIPYLCYWDRQFSKSRRTS